MKRRDVLKTVAIIPTALALPKEVLAKEVLELPRTRPAMYEFMRFLKATNVGAAEYIDTLRDRTMSLLREHVTSMLQEYGQSLKSEPPMTGLTQAVEEYFLLGEVFIQRYRIIKPEALQVDWRSSDENGNIAEGISDVQSGETLQGVVHIAHRTDAQRCHGWSVLSPYVRTYSANPRFDIRTIEGFEGLVQTKVEQGFKDFKEGFDL